MTRKLARLLVISALACFGLALLAGAARAATVQNQNSSSGGVAASGASTATNTAVINVGPAAASTTGTAMASQIGDNSVSVSQNAVAKSGDAVVGSQITGIVGGGDATVQNQNSSEDGVAVSGDADAFNDLVLNVGPTALSDGATAMAAQEGDNDVVITQSTEAVSGDAVVNSQVTGIVGGGDSTTQGQNSATGGTAASGATTAANLAVGGSGPVATTPGTAMASQDGDNAVDAEQDVLSQSGDAVSGSQVTGSVGDLFGFATVREFGTSF